MFPLYSYKILTIFFISKFQTSGHLVNGKDTPYRTVAFEKFPVPTTGGIVVGKSINFIYILINFNKRY